LYATCGTAGRSLSRKFEDFYMKIVLLIRKQARMNKIGQLKKQSRL
jgi:hypothetical protein